MEEYNKQKEEIISMLELMLINPEGLNLKKLIIEPGEYCWLINVDLLTFQSIYLGQIDYLAAAVKAAFNDLKVPQVRVFYNVNLKKYDYELLDKILPWDATYEYAIPNIVTFGLVSYNIK